MVSGHSKPKSQILENVTRFKSDVQSLYTVYQLCREMYERSWAGRWLEPSPPSSRASPSTRWCSPAKWKKLSVHPRDSILISLYHGSSIHGLTLLVFGRGQFTPCDAKFRKKGPCSLNNIFFCVLCHLLILKVSLSISYILFLLSIFCFSVCFQAYLSIYRCFVNLLSLFKYIFDDVMLYRLVQPFHTLEALKPERI